MIWKKEASHKRGQILPPVLQYVSWVSLKLLDQLLMTWNVISCILPYFFFHNSQENAWCVLSSYFWAWSSIIWKGGVKKHSSPFSAGLPDQPTWVAEGDSSTNPSYLKMPDFKIMVYKYKVLIDMGLLCIWQKPHIPTCILLHVLPSYPQRILGLYLDKASGIGFTSLAARSEQLFC